MLFKDFGKAGDDPGVSFVYGIDPDNKREVKLRIRQLPLDIEESFRRRYTKRVRNKQTGQRDYVMDDRHTIDFLMDRVCWMWVDCENFEVMAADEDAAKFYREELKGPIEIGATIVLDGKLTPSVKRRIASKSSGLPEFIVEKASELKEHLANEEDDQGKDSPAT
jgi:hypothetical protein